LIKLKVFRVTGGIHKPNFATSFRQEILADKPEHAVEKVRAEFGSRHRVKRYHIKISQVEEVPAEQITNPVLKKMITGEDKIGE
jgi:large subunit ribosomal protein LX